MENSLAKMFTSQYNDEVTEKQASCGHGKCVNHGMPNGEVWVRCVICGTTWKDGIKMSTSAKAAKKCPDSYQRRKMRLSPKGVRYPAVGEFEGGGWETCYFGTTLLNAEGVETWNDAQKLINTWNKDCTMSGMLVEYRLNNDLKCSKCGVKVHETYAGDTCITCHMQEKTMANPKQILKVYPSSLATSKIRTEGEIWKLPKSSSPMWTHQWGYQGSSKAPYIVSHKTDGVTGSTTSDGWACSCMAFTRNTPRTPCKHILNVMLTEGIKPANMQKSNAKVLAGISDAEAVAFKKWQLEMAEQKAKNEPVKEGGQKLNLFANTGRKFR